MMDQYTATEQAYKHGYEKGYEAGIAEEKKAHCDGLLDGRRAALECVPLAKWIPVTERLPEGDKVVLCYKADRGIRFGKLLDATYANGVQAFMDRDRVFAFGATHWMPLPEPPKVEPPKITDQTLNALNRMGDAVHG